MSPIRQRSPRRPFVCRPLGVAFALTAAASAVGCERDDSRRPDPPAVTGLPASTFETVSRLTLEENDTVVNVTLTASIDRDGRLLVADMGEQKVRVYDREGRLQRQFGRKGDGPGEFAAPLAPIRLASGELVVPDMGRGLQTFDGTGNLTGYARPPLQVLCGITQLDDATLLVAGRT